jgi:hypothetical protein
MRLTGSERKFTPQIFQNSPHEANVIELRHMVQGDGLVGEQGSGESGQASVLGPADAHPAAERMPPLYTQHLHKITFAAQSTQASSIVNPHPC